MNGGHEWTTGNAGGRKVERGELGLANMIAGNMGRLEKGFGELGWASIAGYC